MELIFINYGNMCKGIFIIRLFFSIIKILKIEIINILVVYIDYKLQIQRQSNHQNGSITTPKKYPCCLGRQ
jgi:hypothetical protein